MPDRLMYKIGSCDWCHNWEGTCIVQPDSTLACPKCNRDLELRAQVDSEPEIQMTELPDMINPNAVLIAAADVMDAIQNGNDVFNSPTPELQKVREAIDSDESIQNKNYAYTKVVTEYFTKLKTVIYDKQIAVRKLSGEITNLNKDQIDIQSHLNKLANTLTADEREELHLKDVSYAPSKPKIFPKAPKPKKIKAAMEDLIREAARASIALGSTIKPETIKSFVVSRNMTPEDAANFLISLKKIALEKEEHKKIDAQEAAELKAASKKEGENGKTELEIQGNNE